MVAELLGFITELRADIRASISAFESLQQLPSPPPALVQAKAHDERLSLNPFPELEMAGSHRRFPVAQDCSDLVLVGGAVPTTGADAQTVCEPINLTVDDLHFPPQEIDEVSVHDLPVDAAVTTNTPAAVPVTFESNNVPQQSPHWDPFRPAESSVDLAAGFSHPDPPIPEPTVKFSSLAPTMDSMFESVPQKQEAVQQPWQSSSPSLLTLISASDDVDQLVDELDHHELLPVNAVTAPTTTRSKEIPPPPLPAPTIFAFKEDNFRIPRSSPSPPTDLLFAELEGKDLDKLIAAGRERLAYAPCAKLLLWDDMPRNSKGVCTMLASANAITTLAMDLGVKVLAAPPWRPPDARRNVNNMLRQQSKGFESKQKILSEEIELILLPESDLGYVVTSIALNSDGSSLLLIGSHNISVL
jgi:hypothetical protein